MLIRLLTG